jgi:acrylyl-CoA reductase (NADPH)
VGAGAVDVGGAFARGLTPWESMALGTGGLTAALAIHRLQSNGLRPGQGPVAVTGATGGVAGLAIGMLARLADPYDAARGQHRGLRVLGSSWPLTGCC